MKIFISFIFLFAQITKYLLCHLFKNIYSLYDKNCFNDVIIFSHERFRAGHATSFQNGDIIFEFSIDEILQKYPKDLIGATRLFYGLKKMEDIISLESLFLNNLI